MMRTGSIGTSLPSATSAKPAPAADVASWQNALQEAGQTAKPSPHLESKPAAKPRDKNIASHGTVAVAQLPPAATEKTLLPPSKKPPTQVEQGDAPQVPQESKDKKNVVAQPVAAQPVIVSPVYLNTSGNKMSATTNVAKPVITSTDRTAALPVPGGRSDVKIVDISDKLMPPEHDAAQPASLPADSGTFASPVSSMAVPSPSVSPAASTAHTDKTVAVSDKEISTIASIGSANGKVSPPVTSTDEAPVLSMALPEKDNDKTDKQTLTIASALPPSPMFQSIPAAQSIAPTTQSTTPITQPSAAGLAAAVTAMHQSGQSGALLRLDPPGLGNLSVHVTLAQNGQVNVLFLPTTQDASTALQNNLSGLGAALAQSGIMLGQAQVGGQFNQNAGQHAYQPQPRADTAQQSRNFETDTPPQAGVSAYA